MRHRFNLRMFRSQADPPLAPLGGAEADKHSPTARGMPAGAPSGLQAGWPAAYAAAEGPS